MFFYTKVEGGQGLYAMKVIHKHSANVNVHYLTMPESKNVVKTISSLAMSTRRQLRHALRSLPSCCFLVTCPSLALRRSHVLSRMGSDHVGGIRSWGIRFRVIRITSGCLFLCVFGFPRCRPGTFPPGDPPTCFRKPGLNGYHRYAPVC